MGLDPSNARFMLNARRIKRMNSNKEKTPNALTLTITAQRRASEFKKELLMVGAQENI